MLLSDKLSKTLLRTTENYIKALEKWWIITIADLLNHFPRDYDDRTNVLDNFSLLNVKEKNTVLVKLLSISSQKTWNNKLLTKAVLEDKNWFLSEAVWFNRKYLSTQLKSFENKKIIISWKVKYSWRPCLCWPKRFWRFSWPWEISWNEGEKKKEKARSE